MKEHIAQSLTTVLSELIAANTLPAVTIPAIQVTHNKDKQQGDFATNIAMILAKPMQLAPRAVAEKIVQAFPKSNDILKIEIAGPGFINFFVAATTLQSIIADILAEKNAYGQSNIGTGQRVIVEFVSSNPTGPLHVGHGRHAAFGAALANILQTVGYKVHREYYVNDAGRQVDILAVSVWMRYLEVCGENIIFPSNGYQGGYVSEIAQALKTQFAKQFVCPAEKIFKDLPHDAPTGDKEIYIDALITRAKTLLGAHYETLCTAALKNIIDDMRNDLTEFGVTFDEWFSEKTLTTQHITDHTIEKMQQANFVYQRDDAIWFRSTDFGDDKDRVLKRTNGQPTYFANDLAYHLYKFERGFNHSIDIWGADHHGYVARVRAGLLANGIAAEKSSYLLLQLVALFRNGAPVQMSTRGGSFVTLRELREEIGNDAARFFYVMRKAEQPIDFDLDLAKSQTNENPVFYVQYAHARICSVFRQLAEKQLTFDEKIGLAHSTSLTAPHEVQLLATLSQYHDMLKNAAKHFEPYILTNYLRTLANDFHAYYNACQFLVEEDTVRHARLALITAVRQILRNGLTLLGVSAPGTM